MAESRIIIRKLWLETRPWSGTAFSLLNPGCPQSACVNAEQPAYMFGKDRQLPLHTCLCFVHLRDTQALSASTSPERALGGLRLGHGVRVIACHRLACISEVTLELVMGARDSCPLYMVCRQLYRALDSLKRC
jgi:hypothetical protein